MLQPSAFHKLLSHFPTLIPLDLAHTSYTGFITISSTPFRISLASDCSTFFADKRLHTLLQPCLLSLQQRLQSATHPHEFLLELRDLAERQIAQTHTNTHTFASGLPSAQFYELLLSEISNIGWQKVASITENMRVLDLLVTSSANRTHTINITLPIDYPLHPPKCITSLPVEFHLDWYPDSTLAALLRQFKEQVEAFRDFFHAMSDLDEHTNILEPEHPTMRETYRRLMLDGHCSLRIDIDPQQPIKGFPECRFLGSEAAITPFKERLNRNIHLWDMSGRTLPRENLQRVLEIEFCKSEGENRGEGEGEGTECGICYAYRLEEAVPDVACDLPECGKAYHSKCLVEWLRALPDTRESFGTISGNCVYCEHAISVAVDE